MSKKGEKEEIKDYMAGYRFLKIGEYIQENDEKWNGFSWKPVCFFDNTVQGNFIFRRKVKKKRVG